MRIHAIAVSAVVTAVCCVAFAGYLIWTQSTEDRTPPVLSFAQEELELSVEADSAILMEGVHAEDEHDGDVTANIVLESIGGLSANRRATAVYAAFDAAGNVTRKSRTIIYTDYHSPTFTLSGPMVYTGGTSTDIFSRIGATDVIDGDLTDHVKASVVDGGDVETDLGTHQVEFRVTNSMGDTARLTIPIEVYEARTYNAELVLGQYIVYLKTGDAFDARSYLQAMNTVEGTVDLNSKDTAIEIESDVDMSVPGVYSVSYTVSHEQYTGYTRLIAVVEE